MTIALVAHTAAQGTSGGATTGAIDTTGATLLVVAVSYYDLSAAPTLSDSNSNSWTLIDARNAQSGAGSVALYYAASPTVGSGHTFTVAGTSSFSSLAITAFSGVTLSSPLDQQQGVIDLGGPTDLTFLNITPTQNDEVLVTGLNCHVGTGVSIDSSFTISDSLDIIGGTSFGVSMAYQIQTTATTRAPTWAWTGAASGAEAVIATFKAAGGGAAAVTGTITSAATEADIVAGGKTIVITLTGDTWVASGGTFDAQRQAIIDGLDSAQSETFGWNNEVRDNEVVSAVVRTSGTVVTITLSAAPAYNITAQETITVTVPAAALTGAVALTAAPTFVVDVTPPPTRQNFYVEALGTSTTTSTSYVNKATLTFTPDASSDYWVIASARVAGNIVLGIPTGSRLRDVTGSTTLRENAYATRDDGPTGDHCIVFGVDKFTSGGSPGAQQFDIDYKWNFASGSAEISNTTILVLKADAADQYAESEGDSSNATSTLADKTTLTFTPASAGDYLIIAAANILASAGNEVIRVVLDQDAGAATFGDCGYLPPGGDVKSWSTMVKLTLSASTTFKIQFAKVSGATAAIIRNAVILALRLDKFSVAQYAEARARTTTTSGSYQDKATLTFTPTAADHLIIGGGQCDIASTDDNVFWTLDKAGTSQVEHIHESNTATNPELNYCPAENWLQKQALTAASTTWKTRWHSEASQTAGFAQSAIAVLDLTEITPAAGNPWSYYAQMRRLH